jgi:hypothetical protein
MQEQHIKMDIPEFKIADTQIVIGVPEFFMPRQKWVFSVPQFKLNSVILDQQPIKKKSADLQNRVSATRTELMKETGANVHALFECYRIDTNNKRKSVEAQFTTALAQMDGVIQGLKAQGADPTKTSGADGLVTDLIAKRAELASQRDKALATFDDALKQLDESERPR